MRLWYLCYCNLLYGINIYCHYVYGMFYCNFISAIYGTVYICSYEIYVIHVMILLSILSVNVVVLLFIIFTINVMI